jgi:hypothetical protein
MGGAPIVIVLVGMLIPVVFLLLAVVFDVVFAIWLVYRFWRDESSAGHIPHGRSA